MVSLWRFTAAETRSGNTVLPSPGGRLTLSRGLLKRGSPTSCWPCTAPGVVLEELNTTPRTTFATVLPDGKPEKSAVTVLPSCDDTDAEKLTTVNPPSSTSSK